MKKINWSVVFILFNLSTFAEESPQSTIVESTLSHQTNRPLLKFKIDEKGDVEDAEGSNLLLQYDTSLTEIITFWSVKKKRATEEVLDFENELENNKLSPHERDILEISKGQQNSKIRKYEKKLKDIVDQQLSLRKILREIHETDPFTPSPSYWYRTYDYSIFKDIDFRLMDGTLDFFPWDSTTRTYSNKLIYFQCKHPFSYFVSEKLHSLFNIPDKLTKIQKTIGKLAKMLRHLSTPSELSLENEITLINLQALSEKTKKPIADILKEKIESLNEDANEIYIPMLAPNYYAMLILIAFQDEAPLHKKSIPHLAEINNLDEVDSD